jgi:hypothetical protein
METGLFEIQADHLNELGSYNTIQPVSRQLLYALLEPHALVAGDEALTSTYPIAKRTVCAYPISPITRSIVSAGMKQPCGARLLRP